MMKNKKVVHITGIFNSANNFAFSAPINLTLTPQFMKLQNYHWWLGDDDPLLLSPISFIDCDLCGHLCMFSASKSGDHTSTSKYRITCGPTNNLTFRLIDADGTLPNSGVELAIGLTLLFTA